MILDSTNMPETTRKHVVVLQCDLKGKLPGLPGHNVKIFTEDAGTKVKVNNKVQLMFVRGAASDGEYRVYWRLLK